MANACKAVRDKDRLLTITGSVIRAMRTRSEDKLNQSVQYKYGSLDAIT